MCKISSHHKKFVQPNKYISHVEMRKPAMKLLRNISYKMFKQNEGTYSYLWLSSYVSWLLTYLCIYFSFSFLWDLYLYAPHFPKFSSRRILHFSFLLLLLILHVSKEVKHICFSTTCLYDSLLELEDSLTLMWTAIFCFCHNYILL